MPRPYDPDLLSAILDTLPSGARISKIYYLPGFSSGDNYDQIPVLLPKWKVNEILRWIEGEANKSDAKADSRASKPLMLENKKSRPMFIDPTSHQSTDSMDGGANVVSLKAKSLARNTFTAPDSLD